MKRSREELEASSNGGSSQNKITGSLDEEVKNVSLDLSLAISPEFMKQPDSLQQQQQQQQRRHDSNLTPRGKTKPMSFPISKITIGEWTREAVYEQELKAKIYFPYRKIMWEFLEADVTTMISKDKKIEMQWVDVLSLKPLYHQHNQTGILYVELRKPPRFLVEKNPQAGGPTQWQLIDQDFTLNHSASRNRIHKLHFAPGVLQENMKKLVSGDRFWSELLKVNFPTLEHLYFNDTGDGNSNNSKATQFDGNHESSSNND